MGTTVLSAPFYCNPKIALLKKALLIKERKRETLKSTSSKRHGRTLFASQLKRRHYKRLFLRPLGKTGMRMTSYVFFKSFVCWRNTLQYRM